MVALIQHASTQYTLRNTILVSLTCIICACPSTSQRSKQQTNSTEPTSARTKRTHDVDLAKTENDIATAEIRREGELEIRKQLTSGSPHLRARAALALGRAGFVDSSTNLIALLNDANPQVRYQAAFALRLIVMHAIGVTRAVRLRIAAATRKAIQRTRRAETLQQRAALSMLFQTLSQVGSQADAMLIASFIDNQLSESAVLALGLFDPKNISTDATSMLLTTTHHANSKTRLAAVWALNRSVEAYSPAPSPRELRVKLKSIAEADPSPQTRILAIRAIGHSSGQTRTRKKDARRAALIRWLLTRFVDDPAPSVKSEIARTLAHQDTRTAIQLSQAVTAEWQRTSANHFRLTGPSVRTVLSSIAALQPHARVPTIRRFADSLFQLTDVSDSTVTYGPTESHAIDLVNCAAARLWDLGINRIDRTANCGVARSEALTQQWREMHVAGTIVNLQRNAPYRVLLLRRYLNSPNHYVRAASAELLANIDNSAIEIALIRNLASGNSAVVRAAADTIRQRANRLNPSLFVSRLVEQLDQHSFSVAPRTTCALIQALAALNQGHAATQSRYASFRRWLGSPLWAERQCAARALAEHGSSDLAQAKTQQPSPSSQKRSLPPSASEAVSKVATSELPTHAVLVVPKGEIHLQLLPAQAPATVSQFVRLARQKTYKGMHLAYTHNGSQIETVDYRNTSIETPHTLIPCELNPLPFKRGSVGMIAVGRDTSRGRFFISLNRQPSLDGRFTQFATVINGLDVIDRILPQEPVLDLYTVESINKR